MRSSMIPPSSWTIMVYFALPNAIGLIAEMSVCARKRAASGPDTRISPISDRSNRPTASRTALCSSSSEE